MEETLPIGSIYALVDSRTGRPAFIVSTSEPEGHQFRAEIGLALAAETGGNRPKRLIWMLERIQSDQPFHYKTLQPHVAPKDLDFFARHWAAQFSGLEVYPSGVIATDITTDTGRQAIGEPRRPD